MHAYHVLDATCQITWRPFLLLFIIWTPHNSDAGVQSTLLSSFGRLVSQHVASNFAALLKLDATCQIKWRPVFPFSLIWTPLTRLHGVRSARLSCFGRHLPDYMASIPHNSPNLDATKLERWRPFRMASPIWMPYSQSHGVQFCCSSQVGRHSTRTLASIPHSFHDLDASRTHRWRLFRTASPIWTPRQSTCGVQSTLSSPFGRHVTFGRHATSKFNRQYPRNSAKQNRQLPGFP